MMNSSPVVVTSGRLKWARAVRAAIDAQSATNNNYYRTTDSGCYTKRKENIFRSRLPMIFPSWFNTFKSTRKFHTFSSAIIHNDSRSMHRESLNARSKIRLTCTLKSLLRFASKFGAAIGPSSTLTNKSPSFGRIDLGCATSQVTCANTLVSPSDTCTLPQSDPKCIFMGRNSFRSLPSRRNCQDSSIKFNQIFVPSDLSASVNVYLFLAHNV